MTKTIALLTLTVSILFVVNCGTLKVPRDMSDQELYDRAVEELNADKGGFPWIFRGRDYDLILAYLKEIQLRYTYSPYAALAEVRTADTFYKRGEYEQAAIEYEEFLKRHPGHAEAPYATFQVGMSYYKEIGSIDRDPTNTRMALQWFNTFVEKYPGAPDVPQALENIHRCRNRLARREIYVGNFYSKRDNYKAAAGRYRIVVDDYDDTDKYQEALWLLGRAYARDEQYELARETLNTLVQRFPNEKYTGKASSLLSDIQGKTTPPPEENAEPEAQPG